VRRPAVFFIHAILLLLFVYLAGGVLVGVPFVLRGVQRVDPAARGAGLGFRLLILPATVALWPLLAARWLRAGRAGGNT
jgi:hypothetical protein